MKKRIVIISIFSIMVTTLASLYDKITLPEYILILIGIINLLIAFYTYKIANQSNKIQEKVFEIENKNNIQNQFNIINKILIEQWKQREYIIKLFSKHIVKTTMLQRNLNLRILVNRLMF